MRDAERRGRRGGEGRGRGGKRERREEGEEGRGRGGKRERKERKDRRGEEDEEQLVFVPMLVIIACSTVC